MIIVRLMGGLGNQLFQYAAGKSLAEHHNTELKLDINTYLEDDLRSYELKHFAVSAKIASSQEINDLLHKNRLPGFRRIAARTEAAKPYYRRSKYDEPHFHYDRNFFEALKNVYLRGYWQSECYFRNISAIIRREYQVIHPLKDRNAELAEMLQNSNSVSIHVRRGDYVTDEKTHRFHGISRQRYYLRCIEWIENKVNNPVFFVFSDDIPWTKAHLKTSPSLVFADHNTPGTACEDLRLMSLAKHHIIANSSFSWWSAWLCQNPGKIVVAPRQWFNASTHDTKDLIPRGWKTI